MTEVKLTTTMQQFYHVNAIYKKLIYKGYEQDFPTVELTNEQNAFPLAPAEFLYKGKYSGRKVLLIPLEQDKVYNGPRDILLNEK